MAKRKRKTFEIAEQLDGPTPEQMAKGGYEQQTMPNPDGGNRQAQVLVNRGGTPFARWKRDGLLTQSQVSAVELCQRLWHIVGHSPRLIAAYGERIPITGSGEDMAARFIDARDDLYRIIDYFPGPLQSYWMCFENIFRHDMPAGVAGSDLSKSSRTADARAHQVCCFVADVIAWKERL